MEAKDLIGTWRLVSFERVDSETGATDALMGPQPTGRLTYTSDGYMHAMMMPADRAQFASGDVFGTAEERLAAADHFVAYCGPFDIEGDTIYHSPDLSFFPNWAGTRMAREAKLEGNRLMLTSHEQLRGGRKSTSLIVWERDGSGRRELGL